MKTRLRPVIVTLAALAMARTAPVLAGPVTGPVPEPEAMPAAAPLSGLSAGLEAMRSGRFDEATGLFSRLSVSDPADPVAPLLQGMSLWWRSEAGSDPSATQAGVEERLAEAARRARAMSTSPRPHERTRGLTFLGISLMLEARSRAARGAALSAGSPAREGHRVLSEALRLTPGDPDALFAMGAYNYYADNVGVLVKGLRALLFIPGGDETLGIRQLEQAADRSDLFGTESLLLLSHIFSGSFEEDDRRADGYLERAGARHPRSPLLMLLRADLLYRLGRLAETSSLAHRAGVLAREEAAPQRGMILEAGYRETFALLAARRPDEALDVAESTLHAASIGDPQRRQRWSALLAALARESGDIPRALGLLKELESPAAGTKEARRSRPGESTAAANVRRAAARRQAQAGETDAALQDLRRLAAEMPTDARVAYDLGRLLQKQRRFYEARPSLDVAARSALPEVAGWALMRLGWDQERLGLRAAAVDYYHKAGDLKRFSFRAAARDRERYPSSIEPEG